MDILPGPETTTGPGVKLSACKTFFCDGGGGVGPDFWNKFPTSRREGGREGELELIMHICVIDTNITSHPCKK